MRSVFGTIVSLFASLLVISYWIFGGVSYIWAIIIAFKTSGLIAALVTLFLPLLGQAYWVYNQYKSYGFESMFVLISAVALATWIISYLVMMIAGAVAKDE